MSAAGEDVVTIDRLVDHISTVPAVAGERVQLFLREKVRATVAEAPRGALAGKIVLMVHGGFWPSSVAFDLAYRDYSWMHFLADAGHDVFAMDMTGYGYSSRPMMDDPANLAPDDQDLLIPRTLAARLPARYPFRLVDTDTEMADIDRIVDYIRELRGVERISLIGWSGGGIRFGIYTSRFGAKVDRLILFASSLYKRDGPSEPPGAMPLPGYPVNFQTRAVGEGERWTPNVRRAGQVEKGLQDVVWRESMIADAVGASWGPGGLRGPTRTYWGWNEAAAARIDLPTLVMAGEIDALHPMNVQIHEDLGAERKVFLTVNSASHFMVWETQRRVLHRASLEWLDGATLGGAATGTFVADPKGSIERA